MKNSLPTPGTFTNKEEWFLHIASLIPLDQAIRLINEAAGPEVDFLRKDEAAAIIAVIKPKDA